MLQTLTPLLDVLPTPALTIMAVYLLSGLTLLGMALAFTADTAGPRGIARSQPMVLPCILGGLAAGVAAVNLLPVMFPAAEFAAPMRQSMLALRNW